MQPDAYIREHRLAGTHNLAMPARRRRQPLTD
jgi:hypothetical protein